MNRFLRPLACILAIVLFALGCAGCLSTARGRQAAQGKDMMESYLKTRGVKKYAVDTAYAEVNRVAADRLEMGDFVHGDYRINGQKYEYWVNVGTGEVFTTERIDEFRALCFDLILEELGIDRARCVGLCNADFMSVSVSNVMPAEIDDLAAYARSHIHSDDLCLWLWLVCSASEAPPGRWTAEDTADWNLDEARVCVLPDGSPLPESTKGLGYSYFRDFNGDKYVLSGTAFEFMPHQ